MCVSLKGIVKQIKGVRHHTHVKSQAQPCSVFEVTFNFVSGFLKSMAIQQREIHILMTRKTQAYNEFA
jgi:hypothetical protein